MERASSASSDRALLLRAYQRSSNKDAIVAALVDNAVGSDSGGALPRLYDRDAVPRVRDGARPGRQAREPGEEESRTVRCPSLVDVRRLREDTRRVGEPGPDRQRRVEGYL